MSDDKLKKSLDAAAGVTGKEKPNSLTPPRKTGIGNIAAGLKPSAHVRGTKPQPIHDAFAHDAAVRFAFIGAGQGGSRICDSFWRLGYRRACVFNTTDTDFEGLSPDLPRLSLDIGGAAKDMQLARQALRSRSEEVRSLLERSWGNTLDCAIVCAGLGGGSGGGAALPLVQQARQYMEAIGQPVRVGAVVSLPSVDEGPKTASNAVAAFQELLAAKVSPLIVIDNDRVHELYAPPMSQLLPTSNELVSRMLHLFNQLAATRSPFITFDRAEFLQLLDSGISVFGSTDIEMQKDTVPADIADQIRDELVRSVLASVDLGTGRKAACVFVGEQEILDTFSKEYFAAGYTMLNRIVGASRTPTAEDPVIVHRGLYPGDPEEQSGLQCYTMIADLAPPRDKLKALMAAGSVTGAAGSTMAKHFGLE